MRVERNDIRYPLWRKKVDSSLFNKNETHIPNWLIKIWQLDELFGQNTSKKIAVSAITIKFEKELYLGQVTYAKYVKDDTQYKLFYSNDLSEKLKDVFIMSYMRSLEQKLRRGNVNYSGIDIEDEIPFWEFIDIEFNSISKIFYFKSHYLQRPTFPELYRQFIKSHLLKELENQLAQKGEFKFIKEDWQPKSSLKNSLERNNIIYYLLDSGAKLLYIGEAESTKRIAQFRKDNPNWNFYRVDCLPSWLNKGQRLEIERLIIRSYASIMTNNREIPTINISDYNLVNKKIDR